MLPLNNNIDTLKMAMELAKRVQEQTQSVVNQ
jgi:hypothetical protein